MFNVLLTQGNGYDLQRKLLSFFGKRLFPPQASKTQETVIKHYQYIYASTGTFGIIYQWLQNDCDLDTKKIAQMISRFTESFRYE